MTSIPDREAMLADLGAACDAVLVHAWRAALSANKLDNLHRAGVGECVVALHLHGATFTEPWASHDLNWQGLRIEVKTVGRVQAWDVDDLPRKRRLLFSVAKRFGWDAVTGWSAERRHAHVWVLLEHDGDAIDAGWLAYVVSTRVLNELDRSTITLTAARALTSAVTLADLPNAVLDAADAV